MSVLVPMMNSAESENACAAAAREKQGVALLSVLAAICLTIVKLVVGLLTNSLGILAEALHSALDLLAALITLFAVRVSAKPADKDHTYGHGKIENLSALFETALLLITCVWIVYEAMSRLFAQTAVEVDPNIWAFLVVIFSIVVDIGRSRSLMRAARKYQSQALEADALHFSTDIWSSCVVLAGLVCVLAARHYQIGWLAQADSVAALGVAGIVVWLSLRLGKRSVDDLLDAVPADLQEKVSAIVSGVAGVEEVKQVRIRKSGPEVFADITLTVKHNARLEKAHKIADRAEDAIRAVLPAVDVVIHVEPGGSK